MSTTSVNSELMIKCTIWEKETFELIDYYNNQTIQTKFKINSSGVLSRTNKQISFTPGENLEKSASDLISIKKDQINGKYIIDSGIWSKELEKLVDEQGAFIVFRGLSFKDINNNISSRYYKLSQGDIIKIGRIYFKVLDIHTKRENAEVKSNVDSTIRGTMMRSSSCSSIMVNGQEIIKGAFTAKNNKNQLVDLCLSGNAKLKPYNNSLFVLENKNNQKLESLEYTMKNKDNFIPRVSSSKELFFVTKKDLKNKNLEEENTIRNDKKEKKAKKIKKLKNLKNNTKDKTREKKEKTKEIKEKDPKNKAICRIFYGDDSSIENPLISPCICKGSMKFIHYDCLKNWLNSKIEEDISVDSDNPEVEVISYNRKDISCELCKEKLPDYVKYNDRYYNISFYKPKFEEFFVLESMRADKHKAKFIHILSLDKKNSINIGRANECELSISELSVSRFHCIIHKDEGDLFLEDNSSKFGTLVLIQNNNMYMNDLIPLRIQINKTFVKLKVSLPFKFTCCKEPYTMEARKYDYQVQNRKCFDILSYFIIKENDTKVEYDEEEKEINNNKKEDLIDDDDNKNMKEEKNEDEDYKNENKDLIDDKKSKENLESEKKSEMEASERNNSQIN
jgi:pSer/pThr/pTyr-binding forkhead associated (FHA) protein